MIGPCRILMQLQPYLCALLCVCWNFALASLTWSGSFSEGMGISPDTRFRTYKNIHPPHRRVDLELFPSPLFRPTFMTYYVDSLPSSSHFRLSFSCQWRYTSLTTPIHLLTSLSLHFHPRPYSLLQVTCRSLLRMRH